MCCRLLVMLAQAEEKKSDLPIEIQPCRGLLSPFLFILASNRLLVMLAQAEEKKSDLKYTEEGIIYSIRHKFVSDDLVSLF
ncbi:uncharacterized protein G2W53_001814 [Senna tora]|uniref:Uncharacterized protein n=1 Tax=Senna tora TaxID=362788 RepID=A0A834XIF7_9FABA|nr:uncharacterized protein G2W53_001814 [Senna tora]